MRVHSSLVAPVVATFIVAGVACANVTAPPRIFVSKVPAGVHVAREDGAPVKITRWDIDPVIGITRGYWVIESEPQWRELFPNIEADRIPLLPSGIDFATETMIVAAPTDREASDVHIHAIVDTAEAGIHVYASQTVPGQGCPPKALDEHVPLSAVRMPRLTKEIHFHLEAKNDDPCEAPPDAKIGCRLNGTSNELEPKLVVEPGKTVACLSQGKPGMRPTIDRTWSFRSLPQGTAAKMTMAQGGAGVSFPTDAFGTYAIGLEVSDDLGRTSKATTDVQVAPPKDDLVVQMLWTKFDPNDDPSTFPRVELHIVGDKTPIPVSKATTFASRNQPWILVRGDCTVASDKPPSWCHPRVVAPTSIESVALDAFPQYRIGVKYIDDRYDGSPVLCVRAFRGTLASEWCDKTVRSEGNWWDVARVDSQTGKIPVPPAPPPSAAPPASAAPVAAAKPFDPSKPRKPGEAWSPVVAPSASAMPTPTPTAKPSATPIPSAKPTATPTPSAKPTGAPAPSSAPPSAPRKPGDPWTP